jgi:DNA-directed RNA polymerase subunit RPC12/RpoP
MCSACYHKEVSKEWQEAKEYRRKREEERLKREREQRRQQEEEQRKKEEERSKREEVEKLIVVLKSSLPEGERSKLEEQRRKREVVEKRPVMPYKELKLTKCSACGAEVSKEAFACPKCGHPLKISPKVNNRNDAVGVIIAILVILVVFFFLRAQCLKLIGVNPNTPYGKGYTQGYEAGKKDRNRGGDYRPGGVQSDYGFTVGSPESHAEFYYQRGTDAFGQFVTGWRDGYRDGYFSRQ